MDLASRTDALVVEQQLPLEESLLIAAPVASRTLQPRTSKHTSTVWRIALDGGLRGYFKAQGSSPYAANYGHHPDEVFLNDCAAWRLSQGLGRPFSRLAAPCIVRDIAGETGSLIAHRSKTDDWVPLKELFDRHPDQCRAAAFFDALIGQQDRHDGNYRYDEDRGRIALIDHGFAFPGGTDHADWYFNNTFFVEERWERTDQALDDFELTALHFLLRSPKMFGLDAILDDARLGRLRERALYMLREERLTEPGQW
jgi:hypothetical protein